MSTTHNALIVFGSGPGVGRNVAALFAERGFSTIILLSRDAARLAQDADFVRSAAAGAAVHVVPADLGDTASARQSLAQIEEVLKATPLECVLFNAARLGRSEFFAFEAEELERDLRISVTSLYAVAQWSVPRLLASGTTTPSFLVTSGMLAKDPAPAMFALAACKAAQYNLVHSLHKQFEPRGVHCALIVIGGKVADESQVTTARNVAAEAWDAFSRPRGEGRLEVLMLDPAFAAHVRSREMRV